MFVRIEVAQRFLQQMWGCGSWGGFPAASDSHTRSCPIWTDFRSKSQGRKEQDTPVSREMALEGSNIKILREAEADLQDANMRSRRYSGDAHMQTTQQSVR
jgi:hypothetical protein